MPTITIPKTLIKEKELVIIPRREYEKFLVFKLKKKSKIDRDIEEALEDVRQGRMIGPFSSIKEGLRALKQAR